MDDKKTAPKKGGKANNKIVMNPKLDDTRDGDNAAQDVSPIVEPSANLKEARALSALQRLHRGQVMRRIAPRLQLAKKRAESRRANDSKIYVRANRKARDLVRQRLIGASGRSYDELSTGEKMQVDKRLENKVKLIKRIAKRIMPAMRKAEMDRLARHTHKDMVSTKPTGLQKAVLSIEAYDKLDGAVDDKHTTRYKEEIVVGKDGRRRAVTRAVHIKSVEENLQKKSEKSGIALESLVEAYEAAAARYDETKYGHLTVEQYSFGAVNRLIAAKRDASINEESSNRSLKIKEAFSKRYDEISEEIKGWKRASSDISKARSEAANKFATHSLNASGALSKMSDARKLHPSKEAAEAEARRIKSLNPHLQKRAAFAILDLKNGGELGRI